MSHARERDHGGRECRAKTGWWPRSRELRCSCSPQTTSTLWVWAGLGNRWSRFLEISRALKRACPSTSHWNLSHRHFQTRCIRDALAAGTPGRSLRSTPRESRCPLWNHDCGRLRPLSRLAKGVETPRTGFSCCARRDLTGREKRLVSCCIKLRTRSSSTGSEKTARYVCRAFTIFAMKHSLLLPRVVPK